MKIRWRKNPKTEDGWFKRIAISLLVALGGFLTSLPASFGLFLNRLQHTDPGDTQNMLGAITSAVLVGLGFAVVCFVASMAVQFVFSFRKKPLASGAVQE